jgi:outer membrane autotransporter protein
VIPPVDPNDPLPEPEVVQLVDPTVEQLTALYEISFSGANIQRFSLGDRMAQIQQGLTGFVSQMTLAPAPTGKEVEGKELPPAFQPGPQNRWGVWVSGSGDFVHLSSTSDALGYDFTTGDISFGIDYLLITDHLAVGIFGGYSHTWANLQPSGSIGVNTGRGGVYATYFNQGWYVNAAAWGGGNSYSTSRQGLSGSANGDTSGAEVSTFGETRYDIHLGGLSFGPLASIQYTNVSIGGSVNKHHWFR